MAAQSAAAIHDYSQAIRLDPNDVASHNSLAWLLATREPAQGGEPLRAVSLAEQACELTNHQSPECLDTLGVSYAAAGRFPEAAATAQKAVELASSAGQVALAKRIETRLNLYREGRAYREFAQPPPQPAP